jgi:flagellar hook-basal body complex protein FliE
MAIDPTSLVGAMDGFAVRGPEWSMADIRGLDGGTGAQGASGRDFGGELVDQVGELAKTQTEAAHSARSLADGTATDVSQVVMDVERARLAMQLASQIRTKGLEAFQDVFHTQV